MRSLDKVELEVVAGGNDELNERVADACEGLPDSADVTVTASTSAEMGILGNGVDASTSTTIEVNCGDFRDAQSEGS